MARECPRMEKQVSFSWKHHCLTINILLSLIKNEKKLTKRLPRIFLSDSFARRKYYKLMFNYTGNKGSYVQLYSQQTTKK